ncbi:hypothetical protein GOBAR_DD29096 [Gossypium barbadense]|nr:hypothetical protein GOBAR_DD29096 [Gossypium barbadense]
MQIHPLERLPRPSMVGTIVQYMNEEIESYCTQCVICLEEFQDGDCCRVLHNCRHLYHQLCIDEWLVKEACRGEVHCLEPTPTTDQITWKLLFLREITPIIWVRTRVV